jgi:hypothetical protein
MSKRDWCRRAPYKCVGLYGLLTSFSVRSLFSFYIYYCPALLAECSGGGSREPEIQKVPSWMNQDLGSLITTIDSRDCCSLPVAPPRHGNFAPYWNICRRGKTFFTSTTR